MLRIFIFTCLIYLITSAFLCNSYCAAQPQCTSPDNCIGACNAQFLFTAGTPNKCSLLTPAVGTYKLFISQLPGSTYFTTTGYRSSQNLTTLTCVDAATTPTYYALGKMALNDNINKTWTGLGVNHFQVSISWSYFVVGLPTSIIGHQFKDQNNITVHTASDTISCPASTTVTGCFAGTACVTNKVFLFNHNTDALTANFFTSTAIGSTFVATTATSFWALKDIHIILSLCDPTCATCTGFAYTTCTSCIAGLYLQGTVCVATCPYYVQPIQRLCVTNCFKYYYLNPANNFCQPCPMNCSVCLSAVDCLVWDQNTSPSNTLKDYISLWILITLFGVVLISVLIWKLCFSQKDFFAKMQEEVIDKKNNHNTTLQTMQAQNISNHNLDINTHWAQAIDDLYLSKVHVKKRTGKDTIQGIGTQ